MRMWELFLRRWCCMITMRAFHFLFFCWGHPLPCRLMGLGGGVHWIATCPAHPNQADRPQGSHHVSDGILAAHDPGIGSGWQQSKQNWARPAVVGHRARMRCSDPCCVQDVPLHPFGLISFMLGMVKISCFEILLCQVELLHCAKCHVSDLQLFLGGSLHPSRSH
jgi:hypothetical protein